MFFDDNGQPVYSDDLNDDEEDFDGDENNDIIERNEESEDDFP